MFIKHFKQKNLEKKSMRGNNKKKQDGKKETYRREKE